MKEKHKNVCGNSDLRCSLKLFRLIQNAVTILNKIKVLVTSAIVEDLFELEFHHIIYETCSSSYPGVMILPP